jgi:hypothetical protein
MRPLYLDLDYWAEQESAEQRSVWKWEVDEPLSETDY